MYHDLIDVAKKTHCLEKNELKLLLLNDSSHEYLMQAADQIRQEYVGNAVHLRGLIEFSNYCKQNCLYCGLRRENKKVQRYRLTPDQIVACAIKAKEMGYKTVVLQSGEDVFFTPQIMKDILQDIKKLDLAISLSVGEKTFEEYQSYKQAGADRFLLRIETTDRSLYHRLDPLMSWENRVTCLKNLKALGFEVGTGSLVGLPDQTISSLADDILFFKNIQADMVGIGPFIANPETPLFQARHGSFHLSLRVMALTRLLLPYANIPATTAMETLHPNGRLIALQSGANVVMPNVTEGDFRKLYALYPGKAGVSDDATMSKNKIEEQIKSIDRVIATDYGFAKS